ncbi:hypothetical protein ACFRCT_30750, partial [Bacillus mycoides]|uniref:hypothetical protein n=1 Tax=Bacillus mycoides TaxID=1405 RepID=UPI00366DADF4
RSLVFPVFDQGNRTVVPYFSGKALRNPFQLQCAFDTYRTMSALGRLMHGLTLNAYKKHPLV